MKKLRIVMLLALIGLVTTTFAYAVSSSNVAVSTVVTDTPPDMTVVIKQLTSAGQDPWSGTDVTSMTFGALTHLLSGGAEAGVWYSQNYFCVIAFTQSFGKKYEVRSSCTGLTSGTNSLPAGSFKLSPAYASADTIGGVAQGTMPTGAILGAAGSAVATNKAIYDSEAGPAATNRVIRAFYSLPNTDTFTGFAPIPLNQAPGTYAGTVTITIAAI